MDAAFLVVTWWSADYVETVLSISFVVAVEELSRMQVHLSKRTLTFITLDHQVGCGHKKISPALVKRVVSNPTRFGIPSF